MIQVRNLYFLCKELTRTKNHVTPSLQVAVPASVASQITSGAQRYQLVPMAAMAPPPPPQLQPPPPTPVLPQPMVAAPMVSLPLMQQQPQPMVQQPYPPPGSVLVPMYPF